MNKLTIAAAAFLALGYASVASAQTVSASQGDLILGFELAGNPSNLEVDLGSASNLTINTSQTTLAQLNVQDLINTYGSNWYSNVAGTGAMWSVAAYLNGNAFELTSTPGNPLQDQGSSSVGPAANLVNGLATGLNGAAQASNSSSAVIGNASAAASTIPNSYTYQITDGGNGTNYNYNGDQAEQTGAGNDELYSVTTGSKPRGGNFPNAADIGTFSLSSAGVLTFTGLDAPASTPEPSAYALGICAMLLLWVLKRRSTVA